MDQGAALRCVPARCWSLPVLRCADWFLESECNCALHSGWYFAWRCLCNARCVVVVVWWWCGGAAVAAGGAAGDGGGVALC